MSIMPCSLNFYFFLPFFTSNISNDLLCLRKKGKSSKDSTWIPFHFILSISLSFLYLSMVTPPKAFTFAQLRSHRMKLNTLLKVIHNLVKSCAFYKLTACTFHYSTNEISNCLQIKKKRFSLKSFQLFFCALFFNWFPFSCAVKMRMYEQICVVHMYKT